MESVKTVGNFIRIYNEGVSLLFLRYFRGVDITSCGIYCITNKNNNKKYIGQSIRIENRWKEHIGNLKNNKHHNDHLQNSWNTYGASGFSFEIIEVCTKPELDDREDYWIKFYNSTNREKGYNIREAGSNGKYTRESSRIKMSNSQKGKWVGEKNSAATITDKTAIVVINELVKGKTITEISKETNVSKKIIRRIKNKEYWTHLSNGLEFPCLQTSKFIGVYYDKGYKHWSASLNFNKKRVYLEFFNTEIEAAIARDVQAKKYFGSKARLNFK